MELFFLIAGAIVGFAGLITQNEDRLSNEAYQDASLLLQEDAATLAQDSLTWEKEQADIANQSMLTGMQTDLDILNTELFVDQEQLATYERALSGFDAYSTTKQTAAVEQGRGTFDQLMSNYEGTEALMAATGRGAGSGAIVGNAAEKSLERYAGSDLLYNTTGGGLFADQYQQLVTDLAEEKLGITGQISVFEESIGIIEESIETTEAGIEALEAALL